MRYWIYGALIIAASYAFALWVGMQPPIIGR